MDTDLKHPAKFTPEIIVAAAPFLQDYHRVLDPFAGVGRVHLLDYYGDFETVGVEIEPEWAEMHADTVVGDALQLPFARHSFDAVFTSPTYGNRLADHHNAQDGSVRRSYTHDLGRTLHQDNSGTLHWGDEYRQFHKLAWQEVGRVVRPGGRFVLNIKNHIRKGTEQKVVEWHFDCLIGLRWKYMYAKAIPAKGMRYGANHQARVDHEFLLVFDKPIVD